MPSAVRESTRQTFFFGFLYTLPSAGSRALGKGFFSFFNSFAECWILSTRQRLYLYFFKISLPSAGSGHSAKKNAWHLSARAHFLSHFSHSSTPARAAASTRDRRCRHHRTPPPADLASRCRRHPTRPGRSRPACRPGPSQPEVICLFFK